MKRTGIALLLVVFAVGIGVWITILKPRTLNLKPEGSSIKSSINLDDIVSGGPPKDGIPSIDNPKFESVAAADAYLDDGLLGIGIADGETARFYPFQILVWHELVNDTVNGRPILVSYCPLCGTAIVYDRRVDGKPVEFGVSGKLYKSDLLMYDRKTDSLWAQVTGEALVGPETGKKLVLYPLFENARWGDWKARYPDGEVLSRDTGHVRDYARTPYAEYDASPNPWFPVGEIDERLTAKAWVAGIVINGTAKAYPYDIMATRKAIDDTVGGKEVTVMKDPQDGIKAFERGTETRIPVIPSFWFAWAAFYPETLLLE